MTQRIVVAVPCHADEPGILRTVQSLAASAQRIPDASVRIVVCINGSEPRGVAFRALDRAGGLASEGVALNVIELDVASKPAAWNRLRAEPADLHLFADADITVDPDALPALVAALDDPTAVAATGVQAHHGSNVVSRVARVPHRLAWGGLLGTLYAARTRSLPDVMPSIILDDAWLFGTLGADRVAQVPAAVAHVKLPTRWRDLWRQRVRAERGKAELRALGVPLAARPPAAAATRVWQAYPAKEWPYVAALAAIKAAAAARARVGAPRWDLATSTKD